MPQRLLWLTACARKARGLGTHAARIIVDYALRKQYTESGVYNTGRLGATGLYGICKKITQEQAQPGDLVFFEGTMGDAADGITHVGIYVGWNHMLHCGSPIGYADLTESYWRKHFYAFGHVPYER